MKNIEKNTITVSKKINTSSAKDTKEVIINDINWIGDIPTAEKIVSVRARYRQPLSRAIIKFMQKDKVIIELTEGIDFITSGQSMVIYDGEICLGGGVIS